MITTLTGTNNFLIGQELSQITSKFAKQYGQLAVEKLDGEEVEFERLNEALTNLPFLIEKKLVVLRDPSKNKKFNENIEQIISSIPDSTEVIIVESKIDKRQNYYKVIKKRTQYGELNELDGVELAKWLDEKVKNLGGTISPIEAKYLINRLGTNQELLANELDKLLSYDKNITKETVDLLSEPSPQSSVFELLDAAFSSDRRRILELYEDQRQQGVEPQKIMAMIAWQLHVLAIIKAGGDKRADAVAKESKINPFVIRKSYTLAHKLSLFSLKKLIKQALTLDITLKSQKIDADEALKHFLLSLSS